MSRAVLSTHDGAARVAEETLKAGGNAIDAALAGWLELAASTRWGLLAPVTFGVSGMGAGVRFVDGLCRTPGRESGRSVRYPDAESAPPLARLAVPTSVAALAVSVALGASLTLSKLGTAAAASAKRHGAAGRAKFLTRVGGAGLLAFREGQFRDELDRAAPRIDGGTLGDDDFMNIVPEVRAVTTETPHGELSVPGWWAAPDELTADCGHLLTVDRWGTVATASWSRPTSGLGIYGNEVDLPLQARPLVKGLARPPVAQRIPAPHAIGVLGSDAGSFAFAATTGQQADVLRAAERFAPASLAQAAGGAREDLLLVGAPRGGEAFSRRSGLLIPFFARPSQEGLDSWHLDPGALARIGARHRSYGTAGPTLLERRPLGLLSRRVAMGDPPTPVLALCDRGAGRVERLDEDAIGHAAFVARG